MNKQKEGYKQVGLFGPNMKPYKPEIFGNPPYNDKTLRAIWSDTTLGVVPEEDIIIEIFDEDPNLRLIFQKQ